MVVTGFLEDKIGFPAMSEIIEQTMAEVSFIASPDWEDYIQTDMEARRIAEEKIKTTKNRSSIR
jgi:1-deoxy-D-xylulose-5-phosphate reductoisomerase